MYKFGAHDYLHSIKVTEKGSGGDGGGGGGGCKRTIPITPKKKS